MSFSKNIITNASGKISPQRQGQLTLQTPNKVNRISNQIYSQNKNQAAITNLFSSGKLNRTSLSFGNNLNCIYNQCNSKDCKCHLIDRNMENFVFSPSTNFLFQPSDSFEKYMESLSTERINVLKLVKSKYEPKEGIHMQIKQEFTENKENSSYNSNCNSSYTPLGHKSINSDRSKKSWRSSDSKDSDIKSIKSVFSKNHNNTKKNLLTEFEQNHIKFFESVHHKVLEKESDSEIDFKKEQFSSEESELRRKTGRERTPSIKEILNSPLSLNKNFSTTGKKKRKIFECSDHKVMNFPTSLTYSDYKSSVYAPTVFSTQKKEKKRHRKNSYQMTILQEEYKSSKCKDWTKEKISEISSKTGLAENKVYKWLWDQKNKELYEKKRFLIRSGN
jgi:hypothetical protein